MTAQGQPNIDIDPQSRIYKEIRRYVKIKDEFNRERKTDIYCEGFANYKRHKEMNKLIDKIYDIYSRNPLETKYYYQRFVRYYK